ncbi:MAG: nitrogen regulation protein NR(II) [Chromatiales bacterium]
MVRSHAGSPSTSATAGWIVENLSTAILLFDSKLRLQLVNSAGENLLSASVKKMAGQRVDKIFGNDALPKALKHTLKAGQVVTEWDLEIVSASRVAQCVDCTLTPCGNGHGETGVLVEMSSSDGLRRILRDEAALGQQNVLRTLLKEMAHEIKNPLGGIRGAAQLLECELASPAHKEYTRLIVGEVDRLRKLMDRMLVPNADPRVTAVNIHEVLEHVSSLLEAGADPALTIVRDYDPSLPDLLADRDYLIQAFLNIAQNAAQAVSYQGTVSFRTRAQRQCTIGLKRHRLVIRVDIIDDGPGVPAEIAEDIFFPMISGRANGTGLGLSIARSLVHGHGGQIIYSSKPGETIFSVWLPVEKGT